MSECRHDRVELKEKIIWGNCLDCGKIFKDFSDVLTEIICKDGQPEAGKI